MDRFFESGEMSSKLSRNMEMFMETGQAQSSRQEAEATVAGSYTQAVQRVATGGEVIHSKVEQGGTGCTIPLLLDKKEGEGLSGEAGLWTPPSIPSLQ